MLVITHPNLSGKVELAEDEIVALLGKNGSGKTTLINSIMCDQGKIILDQRDFCSNRDYSVLSAVFQEPRSQILANTLEDELRIMSLYHQVNFEIGRKLMGKYFTHNFFKLSDGFKKRFVISSILSNSPRYVLLDEPLSNLDEAGIKLVTEIIPQGSLVAEHRTGHIMNLANKIYLISEGVVREIDRDKLSDPDFLRKNGLRGFKLESSGGNPGEEILDVNAGIRIKVREREVVCLVGPNGSGKTTTLKKLSGKIYAIFQNPDLQFFQETVEKEVKSLRLLLRLVWTGLRIGTRSLSVQERRCVH